MNTKKRYQQECAICIAVPQVPKILPCQHIYCVACLDHYIDNRMRPSEDDDDEDTGKLMCPQCRRPFSCLPKPEFGCEPIGQVHQDFTSDSFLNCAQHCGVIDKVKFKVSYLAASISSKIMRPEFRDNDICICQMLCRLLGFQWHFRRIYAAIKNVS